MSFNFLNNFLTIRNFMSQWTKLTLKDKDALKLFIRSFLQYVLLYQFLSLLWLNVLRIEYSSWQEDWSWVFCFVFLRGQCIKDININGWNMKKMKRRTIKNNIRFILCILIIKKIIFLLNLLCVIFHFVICVKNHQKTF